MASLGVSSRGTAQPFILSYVSGLTRMTGMLFPSGLNVMLLLYLHCYEGRKGCLAVVFLTPSMTGPPSAVCSAAWMPAAIW